ncbi:HlyD family efflux transporter periplasmic adaptor subunit [Sphingomicrobium sp. XHP0239]|uniref:HlyD family efflux transporter periplasmic adaptor subunit n=1 Tax=Sphingomicrobium maritimum TaxID=3133972 RepID=UPI0031CCB855
MLQTRFNPRHDTGMGRFKPKASTVIIFVSLFAIVGFLVWSMWASIDQISRAPGEVIPSGRTQIIQSEEGGTIDQILVQEGDEVEAGQLLVLLDKRQPAAAVDESRAQVAALKTRMARIEAELFNRPLSFTSDTAAFPEFRANQSQLYTRRRQALATQTQALQNLLSITREEIEMVRPLVETEDIARSELLQMQRTAADYQGQITNLRSDYLAELQTEFAATQEELASASQQLAQREAVLGGTELRAPTDGVIVHVALTTIGGVLRAGDEVLQMVPSGDELIVESRVDPADIAFVRVGDVGNVKFDAYDSTIYGAAAAEVVFVSADTLSEETEDGVETYYRVRLSVDPSTLRPRSANERISLQPGMTAIAEIKTGDQTVFQYLTKPILKTAGEALGER